MNTDIVSLAKHIGDALTARRPVHMPRMKMRELGLLLIELKAYREARRDRYPLIKKPRH